MLESIKSALATVATTIKSSIPAITAGVTTTVLLGGSIYYYTVKDGRYEKEDDNVRYVLEEYLDEISVNSIVQKEDGGYAYSLELDKIVDEVIEKLEKANSNIIEYTEGKRNAKILLKKFIKAEIISKYPDLRTEEEIRKNKKVAANELQGGIKIIRKDTSKEIDDEDNEKLEYKISDSDQILTYIPYNQFTRLIQDNDSSVKEYFSIKPKIYSKYGDFCVNTDLTTEKELVLTKEQIKEIIEKNYSGQQYENLIGSLDAFMHIQEENFVNAVFAIAVVNIESSCGTNWDYIDPNSHNWISKKSSDHPTGWNWYNSFSEATEAFGTLIGESETYYFGAGKYTVSEIGPTYCNEEWAIAVNNRMGELYKSIDIKINDIDEGSNGEVEKEETKTNDSGSNEIGNTIQSATQNTIQNTTQSNTQNTTQTKNQNYKEDAEIVVAGWTKETTTVTTVEYYPVSETEEAKNEYSNTSTKIEYNAISINYQQGLSKYSMPAGFLWSLLVMGENISFVDKLADLVIEETDIIIEAQDNISVTQNSSVETYYAKAIISIDTRTENGEGLQYSVTKTANTESRRTTTITTERSNTKLDLVYAETWVAIYKKGYKNTVNKDEEFDEDWEDDAEWEDVENQSVTLPPMESKNPENNSEYDNIIERLKENITPKRCQEELDKKIDKLTTNDSLYYVFVWDQKNGNKIYDEAVNYMYEHIKGGFIGDIIFKETMNNSIENFCNNMPSDARTFYNSVSIGKNELTEIVRKEIKDTADSMITVEKIITTTTIKTEDGKTANNTQTINKNTYTSAGTEVQERADFDKKHNFIEYFNKSGRAKEYIMSSTSWFFEMLESHEKTANMIDMVKYLLYKATGVDLGITTFDFSLVLNNFNYMTVTVPVNGTTMSREEFIECVVNYRSDAGYQERFGQYAGLIYDICERKNINPVLCVAQAAFESGFGESVPINSKWNYWGLDVYNDTNVGREFNSIDEAIECYCDYILRYQRPDSIAAEKSKNFAQYNNKFTGNQATIYDIYAAYAYLGDYHSGRMWDGVNAKMYLVDYMHFPCDHDLSDPTTTEEQAGYIVSYVDNHMLKMAKEIFGNKIYVGGGQVMVQDVNEAHYPKIITVGNKTYKVFSQTSYGGKISGSGCGISCEAIVFSAYKPEENITPQTLHNEYSWYPRDLATTAQDLRNKGIDATARQDSNCQYNTEVHERAIREITDNLAQGKPVIVLTKPAGNQTEPYTYTSAHYITLVGFDEEGRIAVADPYHAYHDGYRTHSTVESLVKDYIYTPYASYTGEQGYVLINQ